MPEINRGIDRTDEDNTLYRNAAREVAHKIYPELAIFTVDLDDNTLGGLARTLLGLVAEGADPRQQVYLELTDETSDPKGSIEQFQAVDFRVRGDGTGDGEEVTLAFNADHFHHL